MHHVYARRLGIAEWFFVFVSVAGNAVVSIRD